MSLWRVEQSPTTSGSWLSSGRESLTATERCCPTIISQGTSVILGRGCVDPCQILNLPNVVNGEILYDQLVQLTLRIMGRFGAKLSVLIERLSSLRRLKKFDKSASNFYRIHVIYELLITGSSPSGEVYDEGCSWDVLSLSSHS